MDAEAIQRSLEGGGLRCTPQRYAVMAFLMECNRHPTAAEIYKAVNRVDPRSSKRKGCGITTSFATAAAMLRIWSGTPCPGLLRAPSASGFFANANSFSGGCARSALRGALPVSFEGVCIPDESRTSASAAGGDSANGRAKMVSQFVAVF